jgi:hypothetical protein
MLLFQLHVYEAIGHFGVNFVHVCRHRNELSVTKTNCWGELERAPQFGGSSSSSAMHYGAFVRCTYVRTRNFSYSDLNPTGFSPRTGYFENFQSLYSDL